MNEPEGARRQRAELVIEFLAWVVAAALVYWLCAHLLGGSTTPQMAYFDEVADSWLDGHWWIENPRATHDLTKFAGQWYVPFYPLPAVLMLPFVAIGGLGATSTVTFAAVVGGLNVGTMRLVLDGLVRRRIASLTVATQRWLTAAFGFSTVLWYMSTQGTVWFVSQGCTALFLTIALAYALWRRPVWAATALAVAMLARPTIVLALPALLLLALDAPIRGQARRVVTLMAPIIIAVVAIAGINLARFDSAFETGYATQNVAPQLAKDLRQHGQFSLRYVTRNVWTLAVASPRWDRELGRMDPDPEGMSVLLTTPILALAWRSRSVRLAQLVGASIGVMALPLLAYYNTGWYQFGYRFALDLLPVAWILVAMGAGAGTGAGGRLSGWWKLAIVVGVAMNYWGVAWFNNG